MAIMIKIVKNQKLYFDAIIPRNNFIQTQNQIPNNEIIHSCLPLLCILRFTTNWGSSSSQNDFKKLENEYEMKPNVKKATVNHFLTMNPQ